MNKRKQVRRGELISISLSAQERDLILSHTFLDGELERRIRVARTNNSVLLVSLTLDDLDELIGYVAAEANHALERRLAGELGELYDRLRRIEDDHSDDESAAPRGQSVRSTTTMYTPKQGQYLSFIYYYTKIHGVPPAEADLQRYFKVSPPAVHQMITILAAKGLIERTPGKSRSVRILLSRDEIADLQ